MADRWETGGSEPLGHPLRAYSPVEAYLPLQVEEVPSSERLYVKSRICSEPFLADFGWMPDLGDDPRRGWLEDVNQKVDRVIETLTLRCGGFHALPFKYVSLSAGGLTFSHPEPLAPGALLEFRMILSIVQPVALFVYGEVLRAEPQTDGYHVTAQFIQTDDQIRDLLFRFVFETERELLRERST